MAFTITGLSAAVFPKKVAADAARGDCDVAGRAAPLVFGDRRYLLEAPPERPPDDAADRPPPDDPALARPPPLGARIPDDLPGEAPERGADGRERTVGDRELLLGGLLPGAACLLGRDGEVRGTMTGRRVDGGLITVVGLDGLAGLEGRTVPEVGRRLLVEGRW
jgi:hypothetical protein